MSTPSTSTRSRRRRVGATLAAVTVAGASLLAGCSSGASDTAGGAGSDTGALSAQPEPDGSFGADGATPPVTEPAGAPDALGTVPPVPDGAVPEGDAVTDGSITTRSYTIEGQPPEQRIASYAELAAAQGWTSTGAAEETGTGVWQQVFEQDGTTLTVVAGPSGTTTAPDGQDVVELSLQVLAA